MELLDITKQITQKFERVSIDSESWDSEVSIRLRSLFRPEQIIRTNEAPRREVRGRMSADEFNTSKKQIFVTPFKGDFFKRCPGSRPGLMCCNYFVLNLGSQCDFNCSYCYLQSFLNSPAMTVYSNIDQALGELKKMHNDLAGQRVRVGTGEVIDSLSIDPLTLYSRPLIETFREFKNWSLEFKTKSSHVDQFLDLESGGNIIVSWSINPQNVIEHEEHGTASLAARLDAARRCLDRGYQIAFHVDPMIWHPEWKQSYDQMIEEVTSRFRPHEVPYFSLGALRFQPEQRHLMRQRFSPQSWVNRAETFTGKDGKMRYDQSLRNEMFNHVLNEFKKNSQDWRIFLCMETPETWATTFAQSPFKDENMTDLFDVNVLTQHRRFQQKSQSQTTL